MVWASLTQWLNDRIFQKLKKLHVLSLALPPRRASIQHMADDRDQRFVPLTTQRMGPDNQ